MESAFRRIRLMVESAFQADKADGGVRLQADKANTKACSRSVRSAASAIPTSYCARPGAATSSASMISAGGTIAFAMECVDRGWLDEPWLRFGSGDALLRAIELIGRARCWSRACRRQPPRRGNRPRQHIHCSTGQRAGNPRL